MPGTHARALFTSTGHALGLLSGRPVGSDGWTFSIILELVVRSPWASVFPPSMLSGAYLVRQARRIILYPRLSRPDRPLTFL